MRKFSKFFRIFGRFLEKNLVPLNNTSLKFLLRYAIKHGFWGSDKTTHSTKILGDPPNTSVRYQSENHPYWIRLRKLFNYPFSKRWNKFFWIFNIMILRLAGGIIIYTLMWQKERNGVYTYRIITKRADFALPLRNKENSIQIWSQCVNQWKIFKRTF